MARRKTLSHDFMKHGYRVLWTYPSLADINTIAEQEDIHPELLRLTGWEAGGVQLFMNTCGEHPKYRYRLKPRANCDLCKSLWRIQNS